MKALLILLISFSTQSVYCQIQPKELKLKDVLMSQEWRSDINVFSSDSTSTYQIFKNDLDDPYFIWGNFISFTDSTFQTRYSASCGVDCFTKVQGNYKFVSSNEIEVFVKTIDRSGFCRTESVAPNKSFGVYKISKTLKGYEIKKLNQK